VKLSYEVAAGQCTFRWREEFDVEDRTLAVPVFVLSGIVGRLLLEDSKARASAQAPGNGGPKLFVVGG
jgi:hypothetical protein